MDVGLFNLVTNIVGNAFRLMIFSRVGLYTGLYKGLIIGGIRKAQNIGKDDLYSILGEKENYENPDKIKRLFDKYTSEEIGEYLEFAKTEKYIMEYYTRRVALDEYILARLDVKIPGRKQTYKELNRNLKILSNGKPYNIEEIVADSKEINQLRAFKKYLKKRKDSNINYSEIPEKYKKLFNEHIKYDQNDLANVTLTTPQLSDQLRGVIIAKHKALAQKLEGLEAPKLPIEAIKDKINEDTELKNHIMGLKKSKFEKVVKFLGEDTKITVDTSTVNLKDGETPKPEKTLKEISDEKKYTIGEKVSKALDRAGEIFWGVMAVMSAKTIRRTFGIVVSVVSIVAVAAGLAPVAIPGLAIAMTAIGLAGLVGCLAAQIYYEYKDMKRDAYFVKELELQNKLFELQEKGMVLGVPKNQEVTLHKYKPMSPLKRAFLSAVGVYAPEDITHLLSFTPNALAGDFRVQISGGDLSDNIGDYAGAINPSTLALLNVLSKTSKVSGAGLSMIAGLVGMGVEYEGNKKQVTVEELVLEVINHNRHALPRYKNMQELEELVDKKMKEASKKELDLKLNKAAEVEGALKESKVEGAEMVADELRNLAKKHAEDKLAKDKPKFESRAKIFGRAAAKVILHDGLLAPVAELARSEKIRDANFENKKHKAVISTAIRSPVAHRAIEKDTPEKTTEKS